MGTFGIKVTTISLLFACAFVLLYYSETRVQAEEAKDKDDGSKHVLVFGGNGFMGAETVERLLNSKEDKFKVTIVNRGNWYWDSSNRIKPQVAEVIHCDRKKLGGVATCADFWQFVNSVKKLDYVIDFSAYNSDVVNDVVKLLKELKVDVGLYILISTDSVYDVCDKNHDGPTQERDAVRVKDPADREYLNRHYDYGHRKLQAEEEMTQQRKDGGFPYFILRLPDVIGPRDTTHRWWIYQLWVGLAGRIPESPLVIPSFLEDYPMSFVYVQDVAKVIDLAVHSGSKVHDQIVNLAWPEAVTMQKLLKDIEKHLGVENVEVTLANNTDQSSHFYLYPTVRRGPIDVTKVQELLNWEPTPWDQALEETIKFYNEAMKSDGFTTQRDEIVQIVGGHLYENVKEKFYAELEKEYDITLHHFRPRDEL